MGEWSVMRLAVLLVGIITTITVLAITGLLWTEKDAPDGLIAIGASGVGALATLLTGRISDDITPRKRRIMPPNEG